MRKKFYQMVDAACYARLGCSYMDLPDFPYGEYYDDQITSHEELVSAADMAVEDLVHEIKYDSNEYESLRWL